MRKSDVVSDLLLGIWEVGNIFVKQFVKQYRQPQFYSAGDISAVLTVLVRFTVEE